VNVLDRVASKAGTAANVVLVVVLLVLLALEAARLASDQRNWSFDLAVGLAMTVAALLRSRGHVRAAGWGIAICGVAVAVAATLHLPNQPGPTANIALLVLAGAAIRVAGIRSAAVIGLTGLAVIIAGRLTDHPLSAEASAVVGVLEWGGALAVGLWLRYLDVHRRRGVEAVRRDERLAMARELHDVVAHHVTGIVVQAQAARLVAGRRPETIEPTLAGIETAGADALTAMHRLVGLLRDPDDTPGTSPGPGPLSELVARFAARGTAVTLQLPADDSEQHCPPEVAATVYRVVQEALTNVVRHARAAHRVTVTVHADPNTVTVDVTDDAAPGTARARRSGGYGLVGMRERVEALGGALSAGPRDGAGWTVHATVPLTTRAGS
jgi:signal transduction histidine kinase